MSSISGSLGLTQNQGAYDGQIDQYQQQLQNRANNPNGIATQQYQQMANQGQGNVLSGIAQTKGLRPSAQATMADISGSQIQGQTAQNAGLMGLQEQQQNQNMLGSLLMGRNAQDLQNQQAQQQALGRTLSGLGSAAAGAMSGGTIPAAMAAYSTLKK